MTVIEWRIPSGAAPNWLMGAASTRAERALIWAGSGFGVAWVLAQWVWGVPGSWSTWQYLLAAIIAFDLFGGAVSNAASSTKRQYFGPDSADTPGLARVLRRPVLFTALHVYPFIIMALYPGGSWRWAFAVYFGTLGSVVVVDSTTPCYLQRPTAMLLFCVVFVVTSSLMGPPGWGWFVAVFLAKLLLAHSVREEPYRPNRGT